MDDRRGERGSIAVRVWGERGLTQAIDPDDDDWSDLAPLREEVGRTFVTEGPTSAVGAVVRGRALGRSLVSLVRDVYPDRKVIVWAHSGHIARQVRSVDFTPSLEPGQSPTAEMLQYRSLQYQEIGDFIHEAIGDGVYCVQFLPYQGTRGLRWEKPRPVIRWPGSVEAAMHDVGWPLGFWDLRSLPPNHWLRRPQLAYFTEDRARAVWPELFDGIVFIETMFPNTLAGDVPPGVRVR